MFRALNNDSTIKDPKISKLTLFHGFAREYGWTFTEIEQELGLELNISYEERSMLLKGIFAGEARYYRKNS